MRAADLPDPRIGIDQATFLGEHHAFAGFAGVDALHSLDGHAHIVADATEKRP
jgi:hypothetical protein